MPKITVTLTVTDDNVRPVCKALATYVRNVLGNDWQESVLNIIEALDEIDDNGQD